MKTNVSPAARVSVPARVVDGTCARSIPQGRSHLVLVITGPVFDTATQEKSAQVSFDPAFGIGAADGGFTGRTTGLVASSTATCTGTTRTTRTTTGTTRTNVTRTNGTTDPGRSTWSPPV